MSPTLKIHSQKIPFPRKQQKSPPDFSGGLSATLWKIDANGYGKRALWKMASDRSKGLGAIGGYGYR